MPLHDKQTKKKERQQKNRYPGKRPQAAVLTPYRYTPSVTTLHTSCLGLFRELLSLSLSVWPRQVLRPLCGHPSSKAPAGSEGIASVGAVKTNRR